MTPTIAGVAVGFVAGVMFGFILGFVLRGENK